MQYKCSKGSTLGRSVSKVATFQYKCSKGSTLGRSVSKVATVQYKCSKGSTLGRSVSKVATFQYKCSKGSTLWQLRLESRNFSAQLQYRKYALAAPARTSQLFSTSVVQEVRIGSGQEVVCLGSSGSKVATFQYKCSRGSKLESRNFSVQAQ